MNATYTAHAAARAQERLEDLAAGAYPALRNELINALLEDPERVVRTPGYSGTFTAAAVVDDLCAGNLHILPELLRIGGMCARGQMDHETHLRASALFARIGAAHAKFHCGDLEDQMREAA